jgi:hypothetical protein
LLLIAELFVVFQFSQQIIFTTTARYKWVKTGTENEPEALPGFTHANPVVAQQL